MPTIPFIVDEMANLILDPISSQIYKGFLNNLGINNFFDDNTFVMNDRSARGIINDLDGRLNTTNHRLDVNVETVLNPSTPLWEMNNQGNNASFGITRRGYDDITISTGKNTSDYKNFAKGEYQSIYKDRTIGTSIEEFTQLIGMNITLKLSLTNYDVAQRVFTILSTKYWGDSIYDFHDLRISYPINLGMQALLGIIYKAKNGLTKSDKIAMCDILEYMKYHSNTYMGYRYQINDLDNATKNHQLIAVRHINQVLVQVIHDQEKPEVEQIEDKPEVYSINVTLKTQLTIPSLLLFNLPIIINNRVLPNIIFLKNEKVETSFASVFSKPQFQSFSKAMTRFRSGFPDNECMLQYPRYDDWCPPTNIILNTEYNPILTMAFTLDEDKDITSFSFNDMDTYKLSPFVTDILKLHTATDVFGLDTLFKITIFANDIPLGPNLLSYDPDTLTISVKMKNKRPVYRVVLSECVDIHILNKKWLSTIIKYRFLFPMTIIKNTNYLISNKYLTYVTPNDTYSTVCRVFNSDRKDEVLDKMVATNRVPFGIYSFTLTADQFFYYLMNTKAYSQKDIADLDISTATNNPNFIENAQQNIYPSRKEGLVYTLDQYVTQDDIDDATDTLFDVFANVCIEMGLIQENDFSSQRMGNDQYVAFYIPKNGGLYDTNLPLRIINYNIKGSN